MLSKKTVCVIITSGVMVMVTTAVLRSRQREGGESADVAARADIEIGSPHQIDELGARTSVEAISPEAAATSKLNQALSELGSSSTPDQARQILTELRAYLASLPPEVAAAAMAEFLGDPQRDAPTGIAFAVGKAGMLDGQPSLRVALLDWLGQIDPGKAGEASRQVLATPTDPDEWAVSLRNVALANAEGPDFLRQKTEELIRNEAWRARPSIGYLEAFDVLVHARATESTGLLAGLVADTTPEGRTLAHAAYLTLDRLTIREPVVMMEQLASQPGLTSTRGPMVANMFARADLRVPEQRRLVREYLLNPARTQEELQAFAGIYPNANYSISSNLLTDTRTPSRAEIVAHDRAALDIVEAWLSDPELARVRPHLQTMHRRLATFVGQSSQ